MILNHFHSIFILLLCSKLQGLYPEKRKSDSSNAVRKVFIPVGSSMDVAFLGGPYPRFGQPLDHFMKGWFLINIINRMAEIINLILLSNVTLNNNFYIYVQLLMMLRMLFVRFETKRLVER